MAHRLKIPSVLQTRAAFEPSTYDAEKGTVEVCFTTGARCLRRTWDGTFYEELEVSERAIDMSRLNNGAPVMDDHPYKRLQGGCRTVIGVVERAWIKGKEGRALVRFSDREDVKPIKADVQNGILRHTSVGYSIQRLEKVEEVDKVPVMRATRWMPFEISLTPIAFDDGATVRRREEQEFHEVEILSTAEESRAMPDPIAPAAAPAAAPPPAAAAPAPATPSDDAIRAAETRAREEGATAERERVAGIQGLVARHKLPVDFGAKLIGDPKVTLTKARSLVLDELAKQSEELPPKPNAQRSAVIPGDDRRDKFVRGASAWLLERAGVVAIIQEAAKRDPKRFADVPLDGGEFRGMSLVELARESLEARGVSTRGQARMDMIGQAFMYRDGMQTTSDFAVLLENVLHKTLLGSYAIVDDTWPKFCKVDTVPDFRPSNRYRTGSFGGLDKLTEHGEFKSKAVPDGVKFSVSAETKGNIVGITRQTIINDDMSALADLAQKLGRAARLSIEIDVYALLTAGSGLGANLADGNPFFHASRANINSTGSAISVAGINADTAILAAQKDPSANEYLDLRPAVLLVPYALRGEAVTINDSQFDPADNKFQKPNYCRGLFREVVGTQRITGTRRYIFADPNVAPAIVVAFLEGQGQAPVLETEDGWRLDGTELKVRLDYKAQFFDPKGGVTNAGA